MSETVCREDAYEHAWDFDDKMEQMDKEEVFIPESVCYHVVSIKRGKIAVIITTH